MTGYDFLFSTTQNLALARDLRGQVGQAGTITIGYAAGDGIQQLLAERVVLNARDAGIVMQAVPHNGNAQADLNLVRVALVSPTPQSRCSRFHLQWLLPVQTQPTRTPKHSTATSATCSVPIV